MNAFDRVRALLEAPSPEGEADLEAYLLRIRDLPEREGYVREVDLWGLLGEQLRDASERIARIREHVRATCDAVEEIRAGKEAA